MGHIPVLLPEVLTALAPRDGDLIVDGTFGGGGYALRVLKTAKCRVYGIDRDLDAITRAEALSDHQPLTTALMARLESDAKMLGAQLVTTEKDAARLPASLSKEVLTLPVRLAFEDQSQVRKLLAPILP